MEILFTIGAWIVGAATAIVAVWKAAEPISKLWAWLRWWKFFIKKDEYNRLKAFETEKTEKNKRAAEREEFRESLARRAKENRAQIEQTLKPKLDTDKIWEAWNKEALKPPDELRVETEFDPREIKDYTINWNTEIRDQTAKDTIRNRSRAMKINVKAFMEELWETR
jgi:hypothetical protein